MTRSSSCAAMTTETGTGVLIASARWCRVSHREPEPGVGDVAGRPESPCCLTSGGVDPCRSGPCDGVHVHPAATGNAPQWGDKVSGMSGDNNSMLIRRRPSVATVVAVLATLAIGTQSGLAAGSSRQDRVAPDPIPAVEVTATDGSSVTIAWPPSSRDDRVVGYAIYVNGTRVGLETPDHVRRWRDKDSLSYTVDKLTCGTGYTIGVDAFDRSDNHSTITTTTVSTSACPDATAPSPPSGVHQVAATEDSVVFSWSPSSDNVGVVEYGLYASGVRVATVSDATATLSRLSCGTSYLVAIDAADAAGNRSTHDELVPANVDVPNGQPGAVDTHRAQGLGRDADERDTRLDGVEGRRRRRRLRPLRGRETQLDTTQTSATFASLQCGTTYALGVDAFDAAGKRSTVAELSTATSPCASTPPPPPTPRR